MAAGVFFCQHSLLAISLLVTAPAPAQSRFLANALPDGDLRYCSNAMACVSSEKAT
jgi:hypothetical protein